MGDEEAAAMYMTFPWSVPRELESRCRTRLFSGPAKDGKCSRPILERDICFFLYELPCASQAIIKETKRRVGKATRSLLNYAIRYHSADWNPLALSLFRNGDEWWHLNRVGVGRSISFVMYRDTIPRLPPIEIDTKDSRSRSG